MTEKELMMALQHGSRREATQVWCFKMNGHTVELTAFCLLLF